jgi:c-di-GMP-binding flagellar brake protein YcgR
MERRSEIRQPIRLRVTFKSVHALVSEYTTSVSKGGCTIRAPVAVPPDTVFMMELSLEGQPRRSLEIEGRVVHATPRKDKGFDIGISYVSASPPRRVATTRFLDQVFAEQLANRKHSRVPVNLIAEDSSSSAVHFLVRDLSRGGMGLKLPAEKSLSTDIEEGQAVEITVWHDGDEPFVFDSTIVRLDRGAPPKKPASIGLRFVKLSEANQRLVDALLYLHRPQAILLRFR